MKKNLFILNILIALILSAPIFSQSNNSDLFSIKNRVVFGNYLFCGRDYLRAINEFNSVLAKSWNDTIQFKIGAAYYRMGKYYQAGIEFEKIGNNSTLYLQAENEILRSLYKSENYFILHNKAESFLAKENSINFLRIKNSTFLLDDFKLPDKTKFLAPYEEQDKKQLSDFYDWKNDPPYKSPTKASIMSALIPGLGKIYANETGDGITAFLFTGLFTYLAINKFENNQKTSAWIYTGLAAFFYAGNIYGSAAAVQNYNAGIKFSFDKKVKFFINERNQFLPAPKFLCN